MHSASHIYFLIRSLMDICGYETLYLSTVFELKLQFSSDVACYDHVNNLPTKSQCIQCINSFTKAVYGQLKCRYIIIEPHPFGTVCAFTNKLKTPYLSEKLLMKMLTLSSSVLFQTHMPIPINILNLPNLLSRHLRQFIINHKLFFCQQLVNKNYPPLDFTLYPLHLIMQSCLFSCKVPLYYDCLSTQPLSPKINQIGSTRLRLDPNSLPVWYIKG